VEPDKNPEPFTVSVKPGPPAVAELGLRFEIEGVGALTVKVSALVVAPPGFWTVMLAEPGEAIRLEGTDAVNWLAETKLVERADPFHSTVAPEAKLEPFTVKVNPDPPPGTEFGERVETVGGG
jgi:hypothetical protein